MARGTSQGNAEERPGCARGLRARTGARANKESLRWIGTRIRTRLQSTRFANHATEEAWQHEWMDGMRVRAAKALHFTPGDNVLDVGCGDGWFSIQNGLMHPGVRFTGIDLYEADDAQEMARLVGAANCSFQEKDASRSDLGRGFDFAVSFLALGNMCETVSDTRRLFANCRRSMKIGAKILIVEPFEEDFPPKTRRTLRLLYRLYRRQGKSVGEEHETILRRGSAIKVLSMSGFDSVETYRMRLEWYAKKDEVMRYFGFEELPFDIPDRFWVLDKPKQLTVITARRSR
jgi:SAM-dependent methyltransferase